MAASNKTVLRLDPVLAERLRSAARRRSYQQGDDWPWTRLARELLEVALAQEEKNEAGANP